MRIPPSSEYLEILNELLKTQNQRVNKYLKDEEKIKSTSRTHIEEVLNKWEALKKYVSSTLIPEVEVSLVNNLRYNINYIEDNLPDNKAQYFKIIITNKISHFTNFIIVNYDMRDIIIKVKGINSPNDQELDIHQFPLEKFTKGKLRRIFFELFQDIILRDTLPKKTKKREVIEEPPLKNPYIDILHAEIDRLKLIAERNRQMMLEANSKKLALQTKRRKEINKMKGINEEMLDQINKDVASDFGN